MTTKFENLAKTLLSRDWEKLTDREQKVIEAIENRSSIACNTNKTLEEKRTFGERTADSITSFGGSWKFIGIFFGILFFWIIINSYVLTNRNESFDPYPYILLNLFLSMLAALQASVIMMSQNRQAIRDRIDAAHDYEINLKVELEMYSLHQKFDELGDQKWGQLVEMQKQQIWLLEGLLREQLKGRQMK
jgi:uncharacterized membrane protein